MLGARNFWEAQSIMHALDQVDQVALEKSDDKVRRFDRNDPHDSNLCSCSSCFLDL